jgi:hypothetical protein
MIEIAAFALGAILGASMVVIYAACAITREDEE